MEQHICPICDKPHTTFRGLYTHFKLHDKSEDCNENLYKLLFPGVKSNCVVCGSRCEFISASKGYKTTCSGSCAVKLTWEGAEERRVMHRENMLGNKFSVGRPKGSKNKKEYPKGVKRNYTEDIMEKKRELCRRRNANTTPEEYARRFKKQTETKLRKYGYMPDFDGVDIEWQSMTKLNDLFDID